MSYDRRYRILIDGEEFIRPAAGRQFRITFSVSTGYSGYKGTGDIAIYNLNKTSMDAIKRGAILRLECGYNVNGQDDIGGIYTGKISSVLHERSGPNTIVRALMQSATHDPKNITKTYPVNTKVSAIIEECAALSGYRLSWNKTSFSSAKVLTRGYPIANKDPVDVILHLQKEFDFKAAVKNETIVINKQWGDQGLTPFKIGEFTGMEMMPEVTDSGINVVTRLNSKLGVGQLFEVDSRYMTFTMANAYYDMRTDYGEDVGRGIHEIFKIDHVGDSWGSTWSSQIEGLRQQ